MIDDDGRVAALTAENAALRREVATLQAQLRALLEAAQGMAWVKDAEGRFVAANQALAGVADRPVETIPGTTDHDLFARDQADAFRADDEAVMRSRQMRHVEEPIDERRDGRTVWLTTRKVPVIGDDGALLGTAGSARDITDERWTADDRSRVHQELIHAQRALIEELATPVLRIGPGLLAVPIIGRVDAARADQLMQALLDAICDAQAHSVILDITGLRDIDGDVAQRLLRAVRAAALVGAHCSLVGVRAEVAQAIVGLDLDLGDLRTFSTLEQALAATFGQRPRTSAGAAPR